MDHTSAIFAQKLIHGRTVGFLGPNLAACPHDVKESAYKGLVCPVLKYGTCNSVWDLQFILLQNESNRTFETRNNDRHSVET